MASNRRTEGLEGYCARGALATRKGSPSHARHSSPAGVGTWAWPVGSLALTRASESPPRALGRSPSRYAGPESGRNKPTATLHALPSTFEPSAPPDWTIRIGHRDAPVLACGSHYRDKLLYLLQTRSEEFPFVDFTRASLRHSFFFFFFHDRVLKIFINDSLQ